ncbi:MAG: ribosomal protection-like ABC-F family protein [Caldicoprobacterales bacterium]|jgi:ATP-binding cassette subfamily F protein 3|nr:ABC-F family ATP-binding cassette domain-containing protein [Clostridiales bacterium]
MILLSCEKISKSFGINVILNQVSFTVKAGNRVGVVGTNGAGKTTLFNLITGALPYDDGSMYKAKGLTIGYLEQNQTVNSSNTVWQELLTVFAPVLEMENRIRSLEEQISAYSDTQDVEYIKLTEEYGTLLENFEENGGYIYESRMRGVLIGLGFDTEEFHQPIWQLSGGQKTKVALARLLLEKPDMLLLDEPTNHLDLEAVQWLEEFLKEYPGTLLTISHDRFFLDSLCDHILEIENRKATLFQGNYSEYRRKKQLQKKTRQKEYELQQKEIQRQEEIIQRFRSFNREKSIKAAESRQKALDKIKRIEKPVNTEDIRMSFHVKKHSGNDILQAEGLKMIFDGRELFANVTFSLKKGDRVGIIGPNGIGKTTLFRIILGELQPSAGSVRYGTGVDIGYYDQEQISLTPDKKVIDEVWDAFPQFTETQIRNTLALFLFRGDDVYKPIHQLSGGERGRVILSKLMLAGNNFLLLDEPTNHLDMASKEILEDSLADYTGTMLIISHDRYFLNKIADRIFEFDESGVTEYLGNYNDYLEKKRNQELFASAGMEEGSAEKTKTAQKEERRRERQERERRKAFRQLLKGVEGRIHALEAEIRELEKLLYDPDIYKNTDNMLEIQQQYNQKKHTLDAAYEEWLELQDSFEEASQ